LMSIHEHIQIAYPQAFSILQASLQDWALAEDCLQDAVEKALEIWAQKEIPATPTAWLITVAKNKAIDHFRKANKLVFISDDDHLHEQPEFIEDIDITESALQSSMGDDVLRLIFCCCHPSLDPETQLAFTLKHVMGFKTIEVANALLVPEKTMEQRLTRGKKKINQEKIPFVIPTKRETSERLTVVLQVIYLIYNEGYSASGGSNLIRSDLCLEAIRLTRWLHTLVRGSDSVQYAELLGLLALMISQEARKPARTDSAGQLILLEQQNRLLWKAPYITESQVLVEKALRMGHVGSYQIQAAISALHNQAKAYDETDWAQIRLLYQSLLRQHDTPVIRLNYGIALANELGAQRGLDFIITLGSDLENYMPYYAALGGLNAKLGLNKNAQKGACR